MHIPHRWKSHVAADLYIVSANSVEIDKEVMKFLFGLWFNVQVNSCGQLKPVSHRTHGFYDWPSV